MSMRAAGFAPAAAGFFAGTAPHHQHCCAYYHDQGKKLLPFHAANITAKPKRATEIFCWRDLA
jgi:hypothetical protein